MIVRKGIIKSEYECKEKYFKSEDVRKKERKIEMKKKRGKEN